MSLTFKKVRSDGEDRAYEVFADYQSVGFVWTARPLSYRGTQGWNRGVRIKDFHPLEWRGHKTLGHYHRECHTGRTRQAVALQLAEDARKNRRYRVLTWDTNKQRFTPQKGVRAGPYTLFGLRKPLQLLREMGYPSLKEPSVLVEEMP